MATHLTIAIITCNRPRSLNNCLNSILNQAPIPDQVLIVDNSPHRTSKKICQKFSHTLPLVYVHEPHPGIPYCRNRALNLCHTKYLAFIDDDCTLSPSWVSTALNSITTSKRSFVIGRTSPSAPLNLFQKVVFNDYANWFQSVVSKKNNPNLFFVFDTKNVILNFNHIKKFRFDQSFSIFEDIDFGLQLKKAGLKGTYSPKMHLYHDENIGFLKSIKKTYRRGIFKKLLTIKWKNFDNFQPLILNADTIKNFLIHPLTYFYKLIFTLGFHSQTTPKITIVNSLDRGANGIRAKQFYQFLKKHYPHIDILDSQKLFDREAFGLKSLFRYHIQSLRFRFFQLLKDKFNLFFPSHFFLSVFLLRGAIVNRALKNSKTTLAIIQYPEDMAAITSQHSYQVLYDSPTIYSDELRPNSNLSSWLINTIEKIEKKVYKSADFVSFHWYTYFDLLHQKGIHPKNEIILNWGAQKPKKLSSYSSKPRVVYMGIINSYWVNPQLLIKLTKKLSLDVYSYQTPDPKLYPAGSIRYKGFMPELSTLSKYQYGLISLSSDTLRSSGFSAKHLDYISHGLPVLCPTWRHDPLLHPTVFGFSVSTSTKDFKNFNQPKAWQQKHDQSLIIANNLSWDNNLQPLIPLLQELHFPLTFPDLS